MSKCEWKENGQFEPCDGFNPAYTDVSRSLKSGKVLLGCCGAEIRIDRTPTSSEPIIKPSGETWVKRENGIDYLWLNGHCKPLEVGGQNKWLETIDNWKPFSEIEITDQIAKLRPMVICKDMLLQLYGVMNHPEYNFIAITKEGIPEKWNNIHIATVEDLNDN